MLESAEFRVFGGITFVFCPVVYIIMMMCEATAGIKKDMEASRFHVWNI